MNLDAKPGEAAWFSHPSAGYDSDRAYVRRMGLVVGARYTLADIRVYDSYTDVWLREFPGVRFNSVHFETEDER